MFSLQEISTILQDLRRVERQLLGTDETLFFLAFSDVELQKCVFSSV